MADDLKPDLPPPAAAPIPPDDLRRQAKIARPDADPDLPHLGIAGDTYTILLSGADTGGRYCLIDMHVPPGGGPPPHRHDFEETFAVLDGAIEVTVRGATSAVRAGETVHVPANAPHAFRNVGERPARLLCTCAPAGQDAFFRAVGVPVVTRTTAAPPPDAAAQAATRAKVEALAPQYRTEMVKP